MGLVCTLDELLPTCATDATSKSHSKLNNKMGLYQSAHLSSSRCANWTNWGAYMFGENNLILSSSQLTDVRSHIPRPQWTPWQHLTRVRFPSFVFIWGKVSLKIKKGMEVSSPLSSAGWYASKGISPPVPPTRTPHSSLTWMTYSLIMGPSWVPRSSQWNHFSHRTVVPSSQKYLSQWKCGIIHSSKSTSSGWWMLIATTCNIHRLTEWCDFWIVLITFSWNSGLPHPKV